MAPHARIAMYKALWSQTVTRTVTNVGGKGTYSFSFSGAGISASVSPAIFTLNSGQKQTLQITVARTTAALNAYTGGQLTWTDGTHNVRIPVVAKPVALAAPSQVSGNYNVTFGYTGPFTPAARGLGAAATIGGSVMTDPTGNFTPVASPSAVSFNVVVPAGTTYARFSLFDANVSPASDLDLYVFEGTTLVGSSGGGLLPRRSTSSTRRLPPTPCGCTVSPPATRPRSPYSTRALGSTDAGNMTVTAPATATLGGSGTINLAFSNLTGAAGTKYLGSIAYGGTAEMPNPTIVRVDK